MSDCNGIIEVHNNCGLFEVEKSYLEIVMPCHITINESGEGSGDALVCEFEAAEAVNVNRVVAIDANGRIFHADKDNLDDALDIVGVTKQSGAIGQLVEVVKFGKLGGASLATPKDNFWLGNNGALVTSPPSTGDWLFVGVQLANGEILIRIGEPTQRS